MSSRNSGADGSIMNIQIRESMQNTGYTMHFHGLKRKSGNVVANNWFKASI